MNSKKFDSWGKLREKGCLKWLLQSTLTAGFVYSVLHVALFYPSSDAHSFNQFLSENALNYIFYTVGMFFAFWGVWLYTESKYQKESKRRNRA